MNRRLPIGIQDFRTIREQGFYYVDKTLLIRRLVDEGRFYFLSRPRRFGKSLLLDTLRSLFEGHEELFRGLDIHSHWDWSARSSGGARLSFDGKYNEPRRNLEGDIILTQLESIGHVSTILRLPQRLPSTGPRASPECSGSPCIVPPGSRWSSWWTSTTSRSSTCSTIPI